MREGGAWLRPRRGMTARPQERGIVALFVRYWLPVLAYVALIAALSAQPHLKPPFRFHNSDKIFHALEYFGLGLLLARAFAQTIPIRQALAAALVVMSCGIVVGTSDE